ncbi:MAG TPA: transposase [Candidatus Sulfotelmatobacter sp.]|nr:transposase [Candidatus Sulfotelmatobacter sp.]
MLLRVVHRLDTAEKAFEHSKRFEFYYTPISVSWLNMIEIEFSALTKHCLKRLILTKVQLSKEIQAIMKERYQKTHKNQLAVLHLRRKN